MGSPLLPTCVAFREDEEHIWDFRPLPRNGSSRHLRVVAISMEEDHPRGDCHRTGNSPHVGCHRTPQPRRLNPRGHDSPAIPVSPMTLAEARPLNITVKNPPGTRPPNPRPNAVLRLDFCSKRLTGTRYFEESGEGRNCSGQKRGPAPWPAKDSGQPAAGNAPVSQGRHGKRAISKRLGVSRTSVIRLLRRKKCV